MFPIMVSTPWAILLCKFKDDNSNPPHPRKFYEDLFTSSGPGTQSMVDFFREMSHGKLDLSGSQIFPPKDGWFTVNHSQAEYNKIVDAKIAFDNTPPSLRGVEPPDPNNIFRIWAEEAATWYHPDIPKVDLTKFSGVVAVANVGNVGCVGWEGAMRAICDEFSVKPSVIGQEMGHGYGLAHSRVHGSDADYQDPYDIMSTLNALSARHPTYDSISWPLHPSVGLSIGPGLNAANMDSRGWLDYKRVRKITDGVQTVVDLHPLHQHDLPGILALYVDQFYVEFRMNDGWDTGFPPVVLIHYLEGNRSYLMPSTKGNYDLTKGSIFEIKEGEGRFYHHLTIEVLDIDVGKRTASVSIDYSPLSLKDERYILPWEYISPAIPLTRVRPAKDIAIVNEKINRTPQWSLRPILKSLADISSSEQFNNEEIVNTIRREALKTIIKIAEEELHELHSHGLYNVGLPSDVGEQSQQST